MFLLLILTCRLERGASFDEVKAALKHASENELKGILGYTEEGVVSQDFVSEPKNKYIRCQCKYWLK